MSKLSHRVPEALNYLHILLRKKCRDITHQFHASVNGFFHVVKRVTLSLSLCSTITAFNHRREQHCFSHPYSPLSLSHSLTHSLPFHARRSIISSPPPLNFTSACCLLTTVALSLAGFEAVGLQTSRRPSVHRRNCCVALPLPKEGLAEEEENGKRGRHGREGAVRASRAHSYGKVSI